MGGYQSYLMCGCCEPEPADRVVPHKTRGTNVKSSAHNRLDMPLLSAEEEAQLREQQRNEPLRVEMTSKPVLDASGEGTSEDEKRTSGSSKKDPKKVLHKSKAAMSKLADRVKKDVDRRMEVARARQKLREQRESEKKTASGGDLATSTTPSVPDLAE
mmetsp:Transcript_20579/g.52103  ORF Transcript_20579/g.52103 Transcript_20579/m.52103 type:complete len:158 (-) Transcript_20579:326-799(-)